MTAIRVLSLGAGVQSTTLLRMSLAGELPRLDHVIFADTGWERAATYEHFESLKNECADAGVQLHVVQRGNLRADSIRATVRGVQKNGERSASMPLFTKSPDGQVGMIRRQCTREYKIEPIEKKLRDLVKPPRRMPKAPAMLVELWMGISKDEMRRARLSKRWWVQFRYPLIELGMTRGDCLAWHRKKGLPQPPRSSCVACPYHSQGEWRELRKNFDEWTDATEFDAAMRHRVGMRGEIFVHRSCLPLAEVDVSNAEDHGQQRFFEDEEGQCQSGHCFV